MYSIDTESKSKQWKNFPHHKNLLQTTYLESETEMLIM